MESIAQQEASELMCRAQKRSGGHGIVANAEGWRAAVRSETPIGDIQYCARELVGSGRWQGVIGVPQAPTIYFGSLTAVHLAPKGERVCDSPDMSSKLVRPTNIDWYDLQSAEDWAEHGGQG